MKLLQNCEALNVRPFFFYKWGTCFQMQRSTARDSNGVEPVLLQVVLSWNVKEVMGMRTRRGSVPREAHGRKQAVFLGEER